MRISGIYKIQSKIKPERVYIGSAVNIERRWAIHICGLRYGKHHSKKLQRHYMKYGEDDLCFSVLYPCPIDVLITEEQRFIDEYKPYFNISPTAGSSLGVRRSEETKSKLRKPKTEESKRKNSETHKAMAKYTEAAFKGHRHTDETKRKMSEKKKELVGDKNPFWGKHHTDETKEKIRKAKENVSEDTRRKISEAAKARGPQSEEAKEKKRATMLRLMADDNKYREDSIRFAKIGNHIRWHGDTPLDDCPICNSNKPKRKRRVIKASV